MIKKIMTLKTKLLDHLSGIKSIKDLKQKHLRCNKCEPSKNGKCFGFGKDDSDIMVIGESPAVEECRLGIPFVGRAGELWNKILDADGVKLNRESMYITNVVKCFHAAQNKPTRIEMKTCANNFLTKEIEIVKPKLLILLGATALQQVAGKERIGEVTGKLIDTKYKIPAIPNLHPSSLFYGDPNQILRKKMTTWNAWKFTRKYIEENNLEGVKK